MDFIKVGKVGKAHGLRGHFFIAHRVDELPKSCKKLFVGENPHAPIQVWHLVENRMHQARPMVRCEELVDRTAVEKFTGAEVWIERAEVAPKSDEEILWADLVGSRVLDRDGVLLGIVEDVYNNGASDILIVQENAVSEGKKKKRSLHLPLINPYVNFSVTKKGIVQLVVAADFFEEFWNG